MARRKRQQQTRSTRAIRSGPGREAARRSGQGAPLAVGVAAGTLALVLYARTLAPTVSAAGDSGELVVAAKLLGVAHPPGYPLYTMLGHLFTLLPFASVAYRVNLMSAVLDALAVATITLVTYRLLAPHDAGERRLAGSDWPALCAAALAGLSLAFSSAFWAYSLVAEVFALNNLLAALILLLLLEWQRRPEKAGLLWAAALVGGLAAAHQQTIVLLLPAFLLLIGSGMRSLLRTREGTKERRAALARQLGVALVLFLFGLLPYLYLPLAARTDPGLNWGDPRTLPAFIHDVTRADYGSLRLSNASQSNAGGEYVGMFFASLYDGFTPVGGVLVLLGAFWLWRRRRVQGLALGAAFLVTGPLFLAYAGSPSSAPGVAFAFLQRFWVLPSLLLAPALGAGGFQVLVWILGWLPRPAAAKPWLIPCAGSLLLVLPLGSMLVHYGSVDQAHDRLGYYVAEDMLAPTDEGALLLIQGDGPTDVTEYVQLVEGDRPDVVAINVDELGLESYVKQMVRQHPGLQSPMDAYRSGEDIFQFVAANLRTRPVYVVGDPRGSPVNDRFDIQPAGLVAKVVAKGSGTDPDAILLSKAALLENAHYSPTVAPETTYDRAIDEAYGQAAFELAGALERSKQDAEAADSYRRAIRLEPGNALAYRDLGLLLANEGAPASAIAPLWREYLRTDPEDAQAAAIADRLRGMEQAR